MEGYPQISQLMQQHSELAIFRKFGDLNMLSLLHLQAEIIHLEEKYHKLSKSDKESSSRAYRSQDWWSLTQLDCDGKREQWDVLCEIRKKLREYNTDLYIQTFIANQPKPNPYDLSFFRFWLRSSKMGNCPLLGIDRKAWDVDHENDLIAIRRRETGDALSTWLINTVLPKFHELVGHRFTTPLPSTEITEYTDSYLHTLLSIFVTVLACLLPISSILILYFISNTGARLGVAVAFTTVFALCLALVTKGKRVEIFAATSAFAAVQVVFLAGNNGKIA